MVSLPTKSDYEAGFELIDEVVKTAGGTLEAIRDFRLETNKTESINRNLMAAAYQLLNLEPQLNRRVVDSKAQITKVAFMGYVLGLMVSREVHADFLRRIGDGRLAESIYIDDKEQRAALKQRLQQAGGLEELEGQMFATLALGKDGLSNLTPKASLIANEWQDDVLARAVDRSIVLDSSTARMDLSFPAGLGLSLNHVHWRPRQAAKRAVIVDGSYWAK